MCNLNGKEPHPGPAPPWRHRVRKTFISLFRRADEPAGLRDTRECAVTELTKPDPTMERTGWRASTRSDELGSLEVWARSAPIRLAGYEEDLAEPHILPGID